MKTTSILSSLLCLGSLVLIAGCGSNQDGGGTQQPANGFGGQGQQPGGNPQASQPGCTTAPACMSCATCYEACVCQTGNNQGCVNACAGQGDVMQVGGGPGGSGNTGSGGAGNTGSGGSVNTSSGGSGNPAGGSGNTGSGGSVDTGAGGAQTAPDWQEVTITSDTFQVAAGDEIYRAQNFANPIGHDVDVIESESFMTPGSHHMFAFHDPSFNANGGVETSSGIEFHAYIHTAQTPQQIIKYPDGIGRFLPAGDGIRLQVHYINTGQDTLTASVSLRIRYVDPSKVQYHAGEVFLNNVGINVPPGKSTATSTVQMPYAIKLLGAASHMHKRAILFDSKTNDGREIYTTTEWNEPTASSFWPGMDVPAGGSISWSCTWQNDTGQTLTFGESAASNEMCIFSGIYYPAPNGAGISKQCLGAGLCL
ncbi:MAG TPA: hypothetical protein VHE30_06220 [Polyangiaceae bacterium]|nr:hypothetical protein [Polyangiaceae bacterium]